MKSIAVLFSILVFMSCSNSALEQELTDVKTKLAEAEEALASQSSDENYPLVHVVYFKLKPKADQAFVISEIEKLKGIEVLHDLEIGTFKDLEDKRALSDYQLMMSMAFKDKADYATYQSHELHLALKEAIGQYFAGPPAVYDYTK